MDKARSSANRELLRAVTAALGKRCVYAPTRCKGLVSSKMILLEQRVIGEVADASADLYGVRASRIGQVINVLEAMLQSALRAAEIGAYVCVAKPLARQLALGWRLGQESMPVEPRFVHRVRRRRRHQSNVESVVVDDRGNQAAGVRIRAGLHKQVVREIALQVVADRQGVLVSEFCVDLARPQNFIGGLIEGDRSVERPQRCGRALRHLFPTAEPEKTVFYKRSPDGKSVFVLEERCAVCRTV